MSVLLAHRKTDHLLCGKPSIICQRRTPFAITVYRRITERMYQEIRLRGTVTRAMNLAKVGSLSNTSAVENEWKMESKS